MATSAANIRIVARHEDSATLRRLRRAAKRMKSMFKKVKTKQEI